MTWYIQNFVDPLLFNNTGEEIAIPKEIIKVIEYYPMRLKDNLLRRVAEG